MSILLLHGNFIAWLSIGNMMRDDSLLGTRIITIMELGKNGG